MLTYEPKTVRDDDVASPETRERIERQTAIYVAASTYGNHGDQYLARKQAEARLRYSAALRAAESARLELDQITLKRQALAASNALRRSGTN